MRTTRSAPPHACSRALWVAEQKAHLHRQDGVSDTTAADGGVRCSAGFGSLASAVPGDTPSLAHPRNPRHRCGRAEPHRLESPCRGPPVATHHRTSRRRAAPALTRATRSTTDPNRRVPTRTPATPNHTSRRRAAPAPTGTTRSHHRRVGVTFADHTPTTARAIQNAKVAEHKAHLHRHHTMSGASQLSRRCQVQRRVRLDALGGSGSHAERRASAEPAAPTRLGGAPPTRRAVSRHTGGRPPPHLAAMSRADHPRATRGAPPTRTAVSRHIGGHAQPQARGDESRQTRPAPREARRARFTTADHTHTAARALLHAMVAEHTAHLHRHHRMSGASQVSGRCQVQRRVRLRRGQLRFRGARARVAHPRSHHRPAPPCRGTPVAAHHRHTRR
ncbi:hypothetical protein GobsT_43830 [Gemmata obscuriglobus]|nr:hypothetical protein GobsT_43830 [Gemmata obscuriglobus]VTS08851.1 unnamed protein product [Gemmata obscuriglobus UQM 2246]